MRTKKKKIESTYTYNCYMEDQDHYENDEYPNCCAIGIISNFPDEEGITCAGDYRSKWDDDDPIPLTENEKNSLYNDLVLNHLRRHNGASNLIVINAFQHKYMHKPLLSIGYKVIESDIRGNSGNRIYIYIKIKYTFLPKKNVPVVKSRFSK